MMERPTDKNFTEAFLRDAKGKVDRNDLQAAMNGNTDALLGKLNAEDRAKVQNLMNDKDALNRLLSSDAAKQIIKRLSQNGK